MGAPSMVHSFPPALPATAAHCGSTTSPYTIRRVSWPEIQDGSITTATTNEWRVRIRPPDGQLSGSGRSILYTGKFDVIDHGQRKPYTDRMTLLASFLFLLPLTRAETEEFLLKASIVSERPLSATANYPSQWRITLDDGNRKHDAAVNAEDGGNPSRRDHRFNVAAYELDKLLELNMAPPSVERIVSGLPAAVTWWADDVAMDETGRKRKKIEPPDPDQWNKQMQAVRLFDELIANRYRAMAPAPDRDTSWGELLITRDWRFCLIDHTGSFRIGRQLEYPQSLTQCDRVLLGKLRALSKEVFRRKLGKYLNARQLDALEARRRLLVNHFGELIAGKGEGAVLYTLPPRP